MRWRFYGQMPSFLFTTLYTFAVACSIAAWILADHQRYGLPNSIDCGWRSALRPPARHVRRAIGRVRDSRVFILVETPVDEFSRIARFCCGRDVAARDVLEIEFDAAVVGDRRK